MSHTSHRMHEHSVRAYRESIEAMNRRAKMVYGLLMQTGRPMTARQILAALYPGQHDPNLVRPRITDLKKELFLEEYDDVTDSESGKKVARFIGLSHEERQRRIDALNNPQMELF